jgi:replicative DNA helicase
MPTTISSTDDQQRDSPSVDRMPHDITAEQSVIGAMLQSSQATATAIDHIRSSDMYDPQHMAIFAAIAEMYTNGDTCGDPILTAKELASRGILERLTGGVSYLHTCMAAVPTVANVGHYALIVKEHAESRRIITAGMRIMAIGRSQEGGKAGAAAEVLSRACLDSESRGAVRIGDIIGDVLAEVDAGLSAGPSTGFADLDRLLHGLRPGLVTIAGRPGMGKSTVAVDITRSFAIRQGIPVLLFSLEMGKEQIVKRILSAESRVPHHLLMEGGKKLSSEDWQRITSAQPRVSDAPLDIDDEAGLTIHEICARSRMRAARGDLGLIIVDHIGLCGSVLGGRASRTEEVGAITRGLHALYKSLNIPVIMVSQLNRGPEQRTDKRPQLQDLRESGNIEQDSTVVILTHREDYYDKESPRAGESDLIVAKHRDGETDTITVASQLHYSRFVDMAVA